MEYNLTLNEGDINLILNTLSAKPYSEVVNIIGKIVTQINESNKKDTTKEK